MSATCNGCGACCDPVLTVVAPIDLADHTADAVYGPTEADWMRTHLTPMRRRDGLSAAAWLPGGGWSELIAMRDAFGRPAPLNGPPLVAAHFYRCDLFDAVARACTDWANRPDMCRGYPWYDSPPDPSKSLPPTCSYRADVGLAVDEVPVEWRARP